MASRIIQQSFNGGEVTPEFFGRIDDAKRQAGAAQIRNFLVMPQGPVVKRTGTRFVRAAKIANTRCRLIPFQYSVSESCVLELGSEYIRFHQNGEAVLLQSQAYVAATTYAIGEIVTYSGVNYVALQECTNVVPATNPTFWRLAAYDAARYYSFGEVVSYGGKWYSYWASHSDSNHQPNIAPLYWREQPSTGEFEIGTPYTGSVITECNYTEANNVLTIVHSSVAPRSLRRVSSCYWVLEAISFVPTLAAPTGTAAANTVGTGTEVHSYVVTAVSDDSRNESLPSSSDDCTNDLLTTGNYNTITWTDSASVGRYNVYKEDNGLYGFIGQTVNLSFVDDNIVPDLSKTPPSGYSPFSAGNYPSAVTYWEQRRVFAGSGRALQTVWMTKTGSDSDMSYSVPSRDDDGIEFKVASRESHAIRHAVPIGDLILLTNAAEWRCGTDGAVTPTSISVRPQSYVGSSLVQPLVVNNVVVYCEARGGHVRELTYNWQSQGYATGDLSIRSPHLFEHREIVDAAFSRAPTPICWFVNDVGELLGLTYMPEQQVSAWHMHTTDGGYFEAVCSIPEGEEDAVYVIVRREIDGETVRYVERFAPRFFEVREDAYHVDCGVSLTGEATTDVTGLDHLNGCTVSILADGAVLAQQEVSGGTVTLDVPASVIHVGLPITATLKTIPASMQSEAYGQARQKNINRAWLRVYRSGSVFVGPSEDGLTEMKQRTIEPYGSPPNLSSEEIGITISPKWGADAQIIAKSTDPLPLTIVTITVEVVSGG